MNNWINFERIARNTKLLSLHEDDRDSPHPFEERNIHNGIADITKRLFDDGHYSHATFEAFKLVDKHVREKSGVEDSGFSLMMCVFNENKPVIKFNNMTTISDKDEQRGFRHIFAGVMSGIRNPRGHEFFVDSAVSCLDYLSIASTLLRKLESIDHGPI